MIQDIDFSLWLALPMLLSLPMEKVTNLSRLNPPTGEITELPRLSPPTEESTELPIISPPTGLSTFFQDKRGQPGMKRNFPLHFLLFQVQYIIIPLYMYFFQNFVLFSIISKCCMLSESGLFGWLDLSGTEVEVLAGNWWLK